MKKLPLLILLALTSQFAFAQGTGTTTFDPGKDGFRFENSFKNIVISELDFITGGLCGGMAYVALDYFYSSKDIPTQSYRPADNSTLRNYINQRQNQSTLENADKWTELLVNPFGWRTTEYFNWGLQGYGGGRLQELKAKIDAGLNHLTKTLGQVQAMYESIQGVMAAYEALAESDRSADLDPRGTPQIPSICFENDACTECFDGALQEFNRIRSMLVELEFIYTNAKDFGDNSIAFGDNASGIHGVVGLVWQDEKRKILESVIGLTDAYDRKYNELITN